MFSRLLVLTAAVFILTTAISAQTDTDGAVLKGGWRVTLIPEAGGPPPVPVLIAFTSDGGVIETDQGPAAPGQPLSIFSAGIGGWERRVGRQFNISYTQLQYDSAHNLIGSFRARITAGLNKQGTELTGDVVVEFYDTDGVLIFTGYGTVHGVKLPVVGAN